MKIQLSAKIAFLSAVLFLCLLLLTGCNNGKPGFIKSKKKVAIVFGGGGAKSAAQVGVLKRLEELGIRADYVVGTSMGSVIGALYAAGYTAEEIEQLIVEDRDLWIYDRKKIAKLRIGDGRKFTGMITRPHFQQHLDDLLAKKGVHVFSDMKVPYKCIATSCALTDFQEVVCENGVVARDVTSSISFPGAFVFADNKGKKLLDGGMMNNLPVDVAKTMKPDVVIAIDLEREDGYFLMDLIGLGLNVAESDPIAREIIENFSATKWVKYRPDVTKRKENIALADIYIHPNLTNYSIKDYDVKKIKEMIDIGYNCCLEDDVEEQLKKLK